MDKPGQRIDPELLLTNLSWIRQVARSLVGSATDADDLVQQVCTRTLERPPTHSRSIKGWFHTVLRNSRNRNLRGEKRRRSREQIAAHRDVEAPTAEQLCERVELQRQIAAMVLGLKEPYRSTVILRFFEDLSPSEIAEREQVAVTTVRSRIARALEKLREQLDRGSGGDRRGWSLALVPLAYPQVASPAGPASSVLAGAGTATEAGGIVSKVVAITGVSLMANKVVVSSAVAVLVLLSTIFWFLYQETHVAPSVVPGDIPQETVSELAPVVQKTADPGSVRPADVQATEETESLVPGRQLLESGGWKTRGRIVRHTRPEGSHNDIDFNGPKQPVAGAVVLLDSPPESTATIPLARQRRVTGADGRFEFAGVPGRNERFRLSVDAPGYSYRTMSFHFDDPPPRSNERDFGDLVIYSGTDLRFRLVGPDDEPITGAAVSVELSRSNPRRCWTHASETRQFAGETEDGRYVLERAACGNMKVRAWVPGYARYKTDFSSPLAEGESDLLLRLEKGQPLGGRVLSARTGLPLSGAVVLAPGTSPLRATTDDNGNFLLDWLSEGSYELSVSAPGHVELRTGELHTGTLDARIALERDATLKGRVLAESTGTPVAGARVALHGTTSSENTPVLEGRTDAGGRFHIAGAGQDAYALVVDHDEFSPQVLEENLHFAGGEVMDAGDIHLARGLEATGRVQDAETEEPVGGAKIALRLKTMDVKGDISRRTAETLDDGTFVLEGLAEGDYIVEVGASGYIERKPEVIHLADSDERDFTLSLVRGARISGYVVGPSGDRLAGANVSLNVDTASVGDVQTFRERFRHLHTHFVVTDREGRFVLDDVIPHRSYALQAVHVSAAPGRLEGVAVEAGEALADIEIALRQGGTIRGRVVDGAGHGVEGVVVSCQKERETWLSGRDTSRKTTTDGDGNYTLEPLAAARYNVRAQNRGDKKHFVPAAMHGVEVVDGQTQDVDLVLHEGQTVAGRVVDADGKGIAGAGVWGPGGNNTQTRKDGSFELPGLAPGTVHLAVMASGFVGPHGRKVTVPANDVIITMARKATFHGRVVVEEEALPPFRVVAVDPEGRERGATDSNDPSGEFKLSLAGGTYRLVAFVKGYAPGESRELAVAQGEVVDNVVIEMTHGLSMVGDVVSLASREPIPGATIQLVPSGQRDEYLRSSPMKTTSSEDGSYRLEDLPAGPVTVRVEHPDHADRTIANVALSERGETSLRVALSRGGQLHGRVHRGGEPLPNVRVVLRQVSGHHRVETRSNAEGRIEIQQLEAGEYIVAAHQWVIRRLAKVSVMEGQIAAFDLDFAGAVVVTGKVRVAGKPLTSGSVGIAHGVPDLDGGGGHIDPYGSYALAVNGPGDHVLLVGYPGGAARASLHVPDGVQRLEYDIELAAGRVAGVVFNERTGETVKGARVFAQAAGVDAGSYRRLLDARQSRATTDDSGRFLLSGLPAGEYSLRIGARGFSETIREEVLVEEGGRTDVGAVSIAPGVAVMVVVRDERGIPLQGAMLTLRDERGELVTSSGPVISSVRGEAMLEGLRPGGYKLTVVHEEFASSILRVSVMEEPPAEVEAILRPGLPLEVAVVDPDGRPVEGAEVVLIDSRGDNVLEDRLDIEGFQPRNVTDRHGRLAMKHVRPEAYTAYARQGARDSERTEWRVELGAPAALVLRFSGER